jgi:predicted metal-dependent hydrolase
MARSRDDTDEQQLSLFDDGSAPALPPKGSAPGTGSNDATAPRSPAAGHVAGAGVPAVAVPGPGHHEAPAAATFAHPRAHRQVMLADHRVAYELRRSRRRSIGFVVSADGLSVSAPRWVGQADIEQALQAKAAWIVRKLQEQRERAHRVQSRRVEWREGGSLPFLGETVILVIDPRMTGAVLHSDAQALPGVPRLTLHLGLAQGATEAQIREVVQAWLQRQAKRVFEERCAMFAQRMGVTVRRLALSSASTRWGSASADGSVRLNWRLVHFGFPVIDYVVAHELAHLREMNHSAAFWDVVRSVLPDYEQHRGHLRSEILPALD